jgi:hypothetical protein
MGRQFHGSGKQFEGWGGSFWGRGSGLRDGETVLGVGEAVSCSCRPLVIHTNIVPNPADLP